MFSTIMNIAASAMSANRLRINTVASNIANAETTRTAEGGPYRRRDVVVAATDLKASGFDDVLDQASVKGVRVVGVVADDQAPRLVYDPGHPDADKTTGMVAMPNISPVTEMVNMMTAANAYKAAAEITTVTKDMAMAVKSISDRS
jgi:flagellar basal-body rod protein FlgC